MGANLLCFSFCGLLQVLTNVWQLFSFSYLTRSQELRGPHDVMNLGILFDIPQEHSHNAVKKVPEEAVAHGRTRAQTHKGIVRVEKIETEEAAQQLQKMED